MSLTFSIDTKEISSLQKYLEKMQSKVELFDTKVKEELRKKLEAIMFEDLKKRFASSPSTTIGGIVYGGEEWSSLSEYYLAKRPERLGGQIYKDTFALSNSLFSMTSDTISEFKESDNSKGISYVFGTKLLYAEKLQKMRPIVFMHEELLKEVVSTYEKFIIKTKEN